jgi:hypothetical protein
MPSGPKASAPADFSSTLPGLRPHSAARAEEALNNPINAAANRPFEKRMAVSLREE